MCVQLFFVCYTINTWCAKRGKYVKILTANKLVVFYSKSYPPI